MLPILIAVTTRVPVDAKEMLILRPLALAVHHIKEFVFLLLYHARGRPEIIHRRDRDLLPARSLSMFF
jgi:hypothetical protein